MLASLLLLIPAAQPAAVLQQDADAERLTTAVDKVTVYGRQALVERSCTVRSDAAGTRTVLLSPFPLEAVSDSFQVKVVGGPGVIHGLDTAEETGYALVGAERQRVRSELDDLQRQRSELDSQLAAVESGRAFVDSLIRSVGNGENQSLILDAALDGGLTPLFDFVRERSYELDVDRAEYRRSGEELDARIDELQAKLDGGDGGPSRYQVARATLFFDRPGVAELRLSYLVPGASWRPTYEVWVSPDLTGVTVGLVAQVTQDSGEDWDDAQVMLSTSTPHVGLDPPSVPRRIYEMPRFRRASANAEDRATLDAAAAGLSPQPNEAFLPSPDPAFESFGAATQFFLPERKTVRATGEPHRILIREVPLNVRPERYVVPSESDKAYMRAEVTLVGDDPLLSGAAKVFLGPDFLGAGRFPSLRPGEKTTINLGVDPNLSVDWETAEADRDEPGFLASDVKETRVFRARLSLSASAPAPIDVLVEDSIPVSRDDRIEVRPTQVQPAPLQDEESRNLLVERGTYRWRLRLAPGQTQIIRWGYVAVYDEELAPVLTVE